MATASTDTQLFYQGCRCQPTPRPLWSKRWCCWHWNAHAGTTTSVVDNRASPTGAREHTPGWLWGKSLPCVCEMLGCAARIYVLLTSQPLPVLISQLYLCISWQAQPLYSLLHCLHFPQDGFRKMIGKANRTQTSRLFIHYTTRCPSATNYLFLLIQRCTTMRKEPQSSPPEPSTSLAKADTCMLQEPTSHCWLLAWLSEPALPPGCCASHGVVLLAGWYCFHQSTPQRGGMPCMLPSHKHSSRQACAQVHSRSRR